MRILKTSVACFAGLFFLLGVGSGKVIGAPAGSVSGIIRDSHGVPLGGAVVTLLQGQFNPRVRTTVTTNGAGKFEIKDLFPGLYSIKVSVANYAPLLRSGIRVVAGKIANLNLMLENLYQQTVLGGSGDENDGRVKEDIESVLRSAASTRSILRILDSADEGEDPLTADFEVDRSPLSKRDDTRGVVNVYTTAYSSDPDLLNVGGTFTEFALIRDINPRTSWVVAGVVSDSAFAEIDSMLRLRDYNGHNSSVRLSLGQLPYLASLSPVLDNNLQRLNLFNLDVQDELRVSSILSVMYGAEFQGTNPTIDARRFRPRWGIGFQPTRSSRFSYFRTTSLPRLSRTLSLPEDESVVFSSPFQHEFGNPLNFGTNRVTHSEVASEQKIREGSVFWLGTYSDDFSSTRGALPGLPARKALPSARGIRVAYRQALSKRLDSEFGYTYGGGVRINEDSSEFTGQNFHVLVAKLTTDFSQSRTKVSATYRWISGSSITVIDPYQEIFESSSPGLSVMLTQAIPYVGKLLPGKLEAQLDVRNLFAKDSSDLYSFAPLRRLEFLQAPKSVRGGIKLKF
jgi:Carboxypeptidase regulatory-like domain